MSRVIDVGTFVVRVNVAANGVFGLFESFSRGGVVITGARIELSPLSLQADPSIETIVIARVQLRMIIDGSSVHKTHHGKTERQRQPPGSGASAF